MEMRLRNASLLTPSLIGDAYHLRVSEVVVAVPLLDHVDALDDIFLTLASSRAISLQQWFSAIVGSTHLQTKNTNV